MLCLHYAESLYLVQLQLQHVASMQNPAGPVYGPV